MSKGKCPKCGAHYYGWALTNPEYQTWKGGGRRKPPSLARLLSFANKLLSTL